MSLQTGTIDSKTGHTKKLPDEFNVEEAEFTGGHPENVNLKNQLLVNLVNMNLILVK